MTSPRDTQKTFQPLGYDSIANAWNLRSAVTIPFEMKAMHDEMGGVYDTMFGRMSGMLGLTNPNSALGFILPFPLLLPTHRRRQGLTRIHEIWELADGTQLWRIFHNGVDTHPIHNSHLFTAQVISRIGQDGEVAPGAVPRRAGRRRNQDVGWKETFKVNPLELRFLALRPTVPTPTEIPFELPNSVRLIDPMLPEGATLPPPGPAGRSRPEREPHSGDSEPLRRELRLGGRVALPHPVPRRDGLHALAGVRGSAVRADRSHRRLEQQQPATRASLLNWVDNSTQEVGFTVQRALDASFQYWLGDH